MAENEKSKVGYSFIPKCPSLLGLFAASGNSSRIYKSEIEWQIIEENRTETESGLICVSAAEAINTNCNIMLLIPLAMARA